MLLTISTIRQLPQAIALGDSYTQNAANSAEKPLIIIGLADDIAHLPAGFISPYTLLPIQELIRQPELDALSAMYTPTEFAAACKPLFVAEAFKRFPQEDKLIYADPNIQFLTPVCTVGKLLDTKNIILTPFVTRNPGDSRWPDEKFFQNIGLYSSDFLALRRSDETNRLLTWWDDRVRQRARMDFCEGLCLDQLWLMHVPVFFKDVYVNRNPGWHIGLWNLHERSLQRLGNKWVATSHVAQNQPVEFINGKGLLNPDEGFFPHQNRLPLSSRSDIASLLAEYRQRLTIYNPTHFETIVPAFGKQPEPVVLRGWRYLVRKSLQRVNSYIDKVEIPVFS
ncbi:hypothetical protein [Spirosoma aerophilum]